MNSVYIGDKPVQPSKVVCVGRNYLEHIHELNNAVPDEMVIFNKPNTSIASRLLSFQQESLHYEGEICFLVHKGRLSAVGLGLDLTKRTLQSRLKSKGLPCLTLHCSTFLLLSHLINFCAFVSPFFLLSPLAAFYPLRLPFFSSFPLSKPFILFYN